MNNLQCNQPAVSCKMSAHTASDTKRNKEKDTKLSPRHKAKLTTKVHPSMLKMDGGGARV